VPPNCFLNSLGHFFYPFSPFLFFTLIDLIQGGNWQGDLVNRTKVLKNQILFFLTCPFSHVCSGIWDDLQISEFLSTFGHF